MNQPDTTGHSILTGSAYRDASHLAARQSLYNWQQPRYDLPGIVLEHLPPAPGVVLDVGCGNGVYLTRIRAERPDLTTIGLDISAGILAGVPAPVIVGDASALPLADDSATAVLAMHMLYHVDAIDCAIAEAVRVLRPGGLFVASTNARDDKIELDDLWSAAAADVLGIDVGPRRVSLSNRFPLEDAAATLGRYLVDVRVLELSGTIAVDEPDPLIAHLASYRTWADHLALPFDAALTRAHQLAASICAREGVFKVSCRGGIVLGKRR